MNYTYFSFFVLFFFINNINSKIVIKFHKYNSLLTEFFSYNIKYFVDYFVDNKYYTDILIGDPPQKIKAFLNPQQSAFYITNKTCLSKSSYNYEKSNNYKLIENKSYKFYSMIRFIDSLLFENITEKGNKKVKIDNYQIFADCEIKEPLCFIIGTKLVATGEQIKDNLLNNLHMNKYIESYYFTFEVNPRKEDELSFIFDININGNKDGYTFIKASSYKDKDRQYLVWGLNFDKLYFNNNINENQLRAEFNINLGCIIGTSSFQESFKTFLRNNNIMETIIQYSEKYYIYSFNDNEYIYQKLNNITLEFYHKDLDYHFTLNYKDLFFEKYDKIYFLIVFNYIENNYWKFGIPFLKKYKFIYNHDSKFIGFLNDKINNNKNISSNNENKGNTIDNQNNYYKINSKIIIIVILSFIFIIIGMIIFGILIGKKIYKVRKNKTN